MNPKTSKKNTSRRSNERFYYKTDTIIEKPFNWSQLGRLFRYMKPYVKTIIPMAIVTMIIQTVIRLVIPIIIGIYAFDKAIANKNYQLLIILVILTVCSVSCFICMQLLSHSIDESAWTICYS